MHARLKPLYDMIAEKPYDNDLRLAFADVCEEIGDVARANMIRCMVANPHKDYIARQTINRDIYVDPADKEFASYQQANCECITFWRCGFIFRITNINLFDLFKNRDYFLDNCLDVTVIYKLKNNDAISDIIEITTSLPKMKFLMQSSYQYSGIEPTYSDEFVRRTRFL